MREEQEFQDWTQERDDRLRTSLGELRHDVDVAGLPDVRFVMRRAGRKRQRAVVGIAAGAATLLGLSWFGYQAIDQSPSTAPAGGTSTTDGAIEPSDDTDDGTTDATDDSGTVADPVSPEDVVLAEGGGPDLGLFVPPALWASEIFTAAAATEAGMGEFETTAMFECDPDNVYWGSQEEGVFGVLGIWSDGSAFAAQRVRVLDSPDAATGYVDELTSALASCEAPAEADNIVLDVEPLELSGAYRLTTEFVDGSDPLTDFVYVVQHEGTPEAVSTIRVTDWSGEATNAEAVAEFDRLADLVVDQ
ncbi:hypothetical protein MWU75_19220 [Ornithinimicrobium sp. F0845]|uniref:hypothetical protein n=1 Tax=Ornithinimicrobium sp. F0845 TaxID=2926412 RepID=UPI001FF4AC04|nr:hypothetical protein [Ornithinimicrobium sp. F0845]MCK0114275.1 hypothetical protein [Ornithinimicrobium sp. F0845]